MSDNGEAAADSAARASQRLHAMAASRSRRRWKAALFIVLLVLAGAVIGVGATVVYFKSRMYRRPPRTQDIAKSIVERVDQAVGLTPEEAAILQERTDRVMSQVEVIRRESFGRMQEIFDDASEELRKQIGDDRYAKWEKYKDEHMGRKRRERRDRSPR